ncbi:hypothetical protein GCM10027447_35490 [Glycomyces halotolerans]
MAAGSMPGAEMLASVAGVALLAVILYGAVHSMIHPWRKCLWCGGTGKRFSWVWKRRFHPCVCCQGSGKHRRWFLRLMERQGRKAQQ